MGKLKEHSAHDYVLKSSLTGGKPIQIIYEAKDGTFSQRVVTVYRMNELDILVWCHSKKGVRSLKKESILSAR